MRPCPYISEATPQTGVKSGMLATTKVKSLFSGESQRFLFFVGDLMIINTIGTRGALDTEESSNHVCLRVRGNRA